MDGSANSCDKLAKQHDGAIVLHKNSGVSVARNAGMEYPCALAGCTDLFYFFGRRRCVEEPSTGFIFRVTRKVYYLSFVETYIDRK